MENDMTTTQPGTLVTAIEWFAGGHRRPYDPTTASISWSVSNPQASYTVWLPVFSPEACAAAASGFLHPAKNIAAEQKQEKITLGRMFIG